MAKQDFFQISDAECSCLQVEVLVEEKWVNRFLSRQLLIIPVSDQYNLSHPKIELGEGKLILQANIIEKEGSAIQIACLPKWDADQQRILLEELEVKMLSKNILLKSAGWFATTFMGAKIDKKIEAVTNNLYNNQLNVLFQEGINIPIPHGGEAMVQVRSVTIREMTFIDHCIKVKAMIEGYWTLKLKIEG